MEQCEKQIVLDKRYLRMARIWAENSYCQRRKVGAILVNGQMIISDGYNGTRPDLKMFAKMRPVLPSHTFFMPRLMR